MRDVARRRPVQHAVPTTGRPVDTHSCPGGCRRQVPVHHDVCPACWNRLPYRLRQPIAQYRGRDAAAHQAAMTAASRWYRTHPEVTT
jgi:hypothetical protein